MDYATGGTGGVTPIALPRPIGVPFYIIMFVYIPRQVETLL